MLHSHMAGLDCLSRVVAEQAFDFRDERIRIGGLDEDVIEARVARVVELAAMRVAGRGDQRNVMGVGIRSQMLRNIESRDLRQLEIEDDQIGQQTFCLRDRLGAVTGRGDAIPHRSQVECPDVDGIRVIVHDQNMLAGSHRHTSRVQPLQASCQTDECDDSDRLFHMQPNLAQVLNTLAHEIRTPLAVSQGYLKLFLDGRLTNAEDTKRAMEQTRQALGALATLCVDMGKVSALSESGAAGVPVDVPAADVISHLRSLEEVKDAAWEGDAAGAIQSANARELAQAIAIAAKAAFDENRTVPHTMRVATNEDGVIVLAGVNDAID